MNKKTQKKLTRLAVTLLVFLGIWVWNNVVKKQNVEKPSITQMITGKKNKSSQVNKSSANQSSQTNVAQSNSEESVATSSGIPDPFTLPEFDGSNPYIAINNNIPNFSDEEKSNTKSFENYSELDSLGRVGVSFANLSKDTMPKKGEKRGSISNVRPSGWGTYRFKFVDGGYLYNRSHMIGWQLSAENDNKLNLATGTRYFNVDGMLPFENLVADYINNTNNHVLYRVTPIFVDNELVMRGLQMEAYSVEDNGAGISYNVYVYNAQPGVYIDYQTGTAVSQ